MVSAREWTYDGTELAWLQERLGRSATGPGHVVSELVPSGFEAYLRVFHRFEATDGSGRTRRWQTWADEAGVAFHSELSHFSLPDERDEAGKPMWQTEAGVLDSRSRATLARCLAGVTGDQGVYFAYDLAALCRGGEEPLVRRSCLADLESVREEVSDEVGSDGPEFWWPQDRAWVVTTDYDLLSTYVGCSNETAERILGDAGLEALPVTPGTRVDWYADRPGPRG
ncbi:hypothetical protein ACFCZ1_03870 [Streptomyces sp. NPDC056224]|uniref:hypothetical protein n=1 Tax=Streptomyces sp. NPDC056224 TaxID=3345750 RepID=UPI0035E1559D